MTRHDDHYTKLRMEPMHYALENELDPVQQTVIKYVTRWKDKGKLRDLEAARDLLIDYIEYQRTGMWKGKMMNLL